MGGIVAAAFWLATMFVLGLLWTRGERVLGQDAFSYVEMVKQFAITLPHQFGDWWPYGYPLAALPFYRLGLSAFNALLLISAASYVGIFIALIHGLPSTTRTGIGAIALVTAAAWSPVSTQLLMFDLADPFFAAALVVLAVTLSNWPRRWAIVAAPIVALAAFGIRYAGVFAFVAVGVQAIVRWRELRAQRALVPLIVTSVLVSIVTAGLLWSNYVATGRITGPQPIGESSLLSWPMQFADLGLSIVAAFTSSHLIQSAQELHPALMSAAGLAVMAPVVTLLVVSWLWPANSFSRPMALIAAGYILTIVTMRATTPFPSLTYPRYVFPAMFPLAFLVASRPTLAHSRLLATGAAGSIILSVMLAARGIAPDQIPQVRQARDFLATALKPGDAVTVNLPARSLAAYFDNRFDYVGDVDGNDNAWTISPTNWQPRRTTFTVVSPRGSGGSRTFDPAELATVMRAVQSGEAQLVFSTAEALIVKQPQSSTIR